MDKLHHITEASEKEKAYQDYQDKCCVLDENYETFRKNRNLNRYDRKRRTLHTEYIQELKKIDKRYSPKGFKNTKKYAMLSR